MFTYHFNICMGFFFSSCIQNVRRNYNQENGDRGIKKLVTCLILDEFEKKKFNLLVFDIS